MQAVLVIGAMVAVFLAGSARQGATGMFFVLAGSAMIFFAPNRIVPGRYWILCTCILFFSSLSLLPQAWFSMPTWRLDLLKHQAFPSLPWVTLAPRETLYWLALLAGALITGLFSLGHPIRSRAKLSIALGGLLGCAGYASLAIYAKTTGWEYPFFDRMGWAPPAFGFFPNRNHTAALLVTGSVLALGIMREGWSSRRPVVFLLAVASLVVCVYSLLFYSMSRGGVIFLVVGVLLWMVALGRTHRSIPLLISSLVIAGVVVWIFVVSEGQARDRLFGLLGLGGRSESAFLQSDLRSRIFQDTLHIVRDYPLTGTGLGTFGYVFPFYMKASLDEAMPIHPESDWLMQAAEAGIPALLCTLALLALLLRDIFRFRETGSWPLRWGLVAAALAAMLHGLVDVPLHRIELGWWVLVLAGLAFGNPAVTQTEKSNRWLVQRLVFGVCGAILLAGGAVLIRSQWFKEHPFPPYRGKVVVEEIRRLNAEGRPQDAAKLGHLELSLSPMERGLYRELGYSEIQAKTNLSVADAAFDAERALNPVSAKIPHDQGMLWMSADTTRTAPLWGDSLEKLLKIQRAGRYANLTEYYSRLLSQARAHPELFEALSRYAAISPEYQIAWLMSSPNARLDDVIKNSEFVDSLTLAQRRDLLLIWLNRGATAELDEFLVANPSWEDAAWPVRVRRMVREKRYEAAIDAVQKRYGIELSLPVVSAEALQSGEIPTDLSSRVAYFVAKSNVVTARREAAESAQSNQPEGLRLQCILALQAGDAKAAWSALEGYLKQTKRENFP